MAATAPDHGVAAIHATHWHEDEFYRIVVECKCGETVVVTSKMDHKPNINLSLAETLLLPYEDHH